MAKIPPPKGTPFPKGQSGNPGGRPRLPEDVAEARRLNKNDFERLLNLYIRKSPIELQAAVKDSSTPALDLMVCTIVIKAIKDGDHQRLTFVLDRLIGRVKDIVEVTTPQPFIIRRNNGEEVILGSRLPAGDEGP